MNGVNLKPPRIFLEILKRKGPGQHFRFEVDNELLFFHQGFQNPLNLFFRPLPLFGRELALGPKNEPDVSISLLLFSGHARDRSDEINAKRWTLIG